MMGKANNQETFVVRILRTENSTWQGSVTWVEQNKKQNFRSGLELIKMIDNAMESHSESE